MEKHASTCQWRINAKPFTKGDPDGKWIVSDFFSQHSCRDCESKRKRNYNSKTINGACKAVSTFIPSEKRLGSTKQLMDMTRESDGIHLTKSHAYKIVHTKIQSRI